MLLLWSSYVVNKQLQHLKQKYSFWAESGKMEKSCKTTDIAFIYNKWSHYSITYFYSITVFIIIIILFLQPILR